MIERLPIVAGAWALSLAATGWWAYGAGSDAEIAARAREDRASEKAAQIAGQAAATAISKIEVQRVEITQPLLREVREKLVYRDCRHSPDGLRGVNVALTGEPAPPGGGQLPAAPAAGR